MLHFIDFEVFKHDWLCVIINPAMKFKTVIINDSKKLNDYYTQYKDEIFVGYNIRGYDQFIFKGILCGFNPKKINDWIIKDEQSGYKFSALLNKIPLIFYDVMPNPPVSLKTLEGFMGINIKESDVDFDIDRPLTDEEITETVKYCTSDVEATVNVFLEKKADFDSHLGLIKTFKLPIVSMGKTQAQLSAQILGCQKVNFDDEWDIQLVDTLQIKKYQSVVQWFLNEENRDYSKRLEINVAGVPHVFAWGGLHGAKEKYHGTGLILHVDVNSFYPSIMIRYGLLSRSVKNPKKYEEIRDKRLEYKKAKDPRQAPYKIVLNGTYGISKDKYSLAYDPRRANEVCINGQLLLLDLIEHLEKIAGFELIQSNTDGLIIKIPDNDKSFTMVDDICYEWEKRCGMGLGFDYIKEIYQKDVNNYVFVDIDGKIERKGAYVKPNSLLDNDCSILNTALVNYFTNHIPVEKTILSCDDLMQFQKVVKVSSKYLFGEHNGKRLNDRVFRVFASKNNLDGSILKCKYKTTKKQGTFLAKEKFANTPEHCFILNNSISGVPCPTNLDKNYYVQIAQKRLNDYGVR